MDNIEVPKPVSKFCRYCKRENDFSICIYCDGKHEARTVFKRVGVERTIYAAHESLPYFNENKVKQRIIERDIKGLEGLTDDEKTVFWSGFDTEYMKLCGLNEIKTY